MSAFWHMVQYLVCLILQRRATSDFAVIFAVICREKKGNAAKFAVIYEKNGQASYL